MTALVDIGRWRDDLAYPDWYLRIEPDMARLEAIAQNRPGDHELSKAKEAIYKLVEEELSAQAIPLASQGEDLDIARRTIDTIVIHHTKNKPGMALNRLNAMQLLRIYGRYYSNPRDPAEKYFKGMPIWSGHFYKGKQVFWAYHWLVRKDGEAVRLLSDDAVGWHAGNWAVNTCSIAICFDDDLTQKYPSEAALKAAAGIILQYPGVKFEKVIGHRDANSQTICPGELFQNGWRPVLQQLLAKE